MRAAAEPSTPGELAYRRIRADILFGRLPPGRKLKLDRLRDDYTASVSTLREVLSRLSSEKLVVAEGQRGFEVAPVSARNLKEIAESAVHEWKRTKGNGNGNGHGNGHGKKPRRK